MDNLGKNLIFLISQPRSGSTLLQHILGSHPDIHTLPEPWFMLDLVYALRTTGIRTEYNVPLARMAFGDFLKRLGDGEAPYWEAIRAAGHHLYERAREMSGKKYFLDKTPRYYLIIPELHEVFPEAKFVFLIRNPLAVLFSILDVNLNGRWTGFTMPDRRHDILSAPRLIYEGCRRLGKEATIVHYEELVAQPEITVENLCHQLDLPFEEGILNYGAKLKFEATGFVDPKSIYRHRRPVAEYTNKWQGRLADPKERYLATSYLAALGEELVQALGYSFDDLMSTVSAKKHWRPRLTPARLLFTTPAEMSPLDRLRLSAVTLPRNLRRCARALFSSNGQLLT